VPRTRVLLYKEEDGSCPFVEWFSELPVKIQDKCYLRLERLVPLKEIDRAVERKKRFEADPPKHTYEEV